MSDEDFDRYNWGSVRDEIENVEEEEVMEIEDDTSDNVVGQSQSDGQSQAVTQPSTSGTKPKKSAEGKYTA